jgi:hypothetical protein
MAAYCRKILYSSYPSVSKVCPIHQFLLLIIIAIFIIASSDLLYALAME